MYWKEVCTTGEGFEDKLVVVPRKLSKQTYKNQNQSK